MESKFWWFFFRTFVTFTATLLNFSMHSQGAAQEVGLPDFSNDYYTEDLIGLGDDPEFVFKIRNVNEEKPRQCRVDICKPYNYTDSRKGNFTWPENHIDTRIYLRCPYSIYDPVYAYAECILLSGINSTIDPPGVIFDPYGNETVSYVIWGPPIIDHCPDPPLSQFVEQLKEYTFENLPTIAWYVESVKKIYSTLTLYPEAPVLNDDFLFVPTFLTDAVDHAVSQGVAFDYETTRQTLEIIDILLDIDTEKSILEYLDETSQSRFLTTMALLSEMWSPGVTGSGKYFYGKYMTVVSTKSDGRFSVDFVSHDPKHEVIETSMATSIRMTDEQILHILHIGYTRFLTAEWLYEKTVHFLPLPPSENSTELLPPPLPVEDYQMIVYFEIISSIVYVSVTQDIEEGLFPPRIIPPYGSVLINNDIEKDVSIASRMRCSESNPFDDALYEHTGQIGSLWSTSANCEGSFPSYVEAQCSCNSLGFFAVFARADGTDVGGWPSPAPTIDSGKGQTFSEFLGFAYMYELYIASNVLRAISLTCLICTVLSYIIFRKARHGSPTRILINLCVTLILFLIILYVAESVAGTRWGCRISNILRYYLVMVSLLWNAVEAVNMYLMLVKVFKTHIHHFVLKAAGIAWGVPLIPIIIILAITPKGFDGIFLDYNCQFSCRLKPQVFYYGYFIPMGIIVICNSVIFGLLLKVIFKHGPVHHGETKRSALVRAGGAISMMILLGIPWVFSAFGALDEASENKDISNLSAVFQIIFIVFINLQGTFIFLFHCVRNEDMRNQWRATFCRCKDETIESSSGSMPMKVTKGVPGASLKYENPDQKNALSKTQNETETTFLNSTSSNSTKDQGRA